MKLNLWTSLLLAVTLSYVDAAPTGGSGHGISWEAAVARAREDVAKLTLEEKVKLTTGVGWQASRCVGNIPPNEKINFPGICLQDGPAGIRKTSGNSAFTSALNVASTFNKALMYGNGQAIGEELRGKGVNVWLAPVLNYVRAPQGGRGWEGSGADVHLMTVSNVLQVQGAQSKGVIATPKHFIANEQEIKRTIAQVQIDDRTLREFYLPPWEAVIKAGAGAVMCSYNKVNTTYTCADPALYKILKSEYGFKGFVMSDWWATSDGLGTATAGMDLMMPGDKFCCSGPSSGSYWGPALQEFVTSGALPESRVTDMATRILSSYYKLGQDQNYPPTNLHTWNKSLELDVNVQGNHAEHIRRTGAESSVLLKNAGGVLPLAKTLKSLAIIGEDAGYGNGPNFHEDRGGLSGTVAIGWGSGTAEFPYIVTPEDAITKRATEAGVTDVRTAIVDTSLAAAATAATGADVALVFVFANSGEEYIEVEGNVGDRTDLKLWHDGDALIKAVADVNPNTVVVIHAPGAVDMVEWIDHPNVKSVIFAGFPGQETGNAIADVLFGSVNPSGRLPFTINKARADYCCDIKYGLSEADPVLPYSEGLFVDYKWNDAKGIAPLFWFGHGLSYTTFGYQNLRVSGNSKTLRATVSVSNTGEVAGAEVVQLYLGYPAGTGEPVKSLRGFEKILLQPGSRQTVSFALVERDLSIWDVVAQKWTVPRGTFTVFVGASAGDIRQTATIRI